MQRVLFICTGNYYRSRFAEAVFNHEAAKQKLTARAFSRGLATWLVYGDAPISANTIEALGRLGISLEHTAPKPVQLTEEDLISADHIIALKEAEHRPMMEKQFPTWADKVEYWHVHDIDFVEATEALPQIYDKVMEMARSLSLKNLAKGSSKKRKTRGSGIKS